MPYAILKPDETIDDVLQSDPGYGVELTADQMRTINASSIGHAAFKLVGGVLMPKDDVLLYHAKIAKNTFVNTKRAAAIQVGVEYNGYTYDSDATSILNLTAAVSAFSAGVPIPPGFTWRTSDNQNVAMDLAQLTGLAAAMLSHVNTAYNRSWTRKAQIDVAATEAEVEAISW